MAHIVAHGKRPLGWEQVYTTTGAARERGLERTIVRVYDNGSPFEHNGSTPVLMNVTSAGQDVVVADSARYYLNSVPPVGPRLCELGQLDNATITGPIPDQELCYYTDIAAFDMRDKKLTPQQRRHVLGGSASMWTDAYCATNECGAWPDATPMAGWMAESPKHDAVFHDSLLASIFPAASVAAGAFGGYQSMAVSELDARWQEFNRAVLIGRGVRSCPNGCRCAEDNCCGKPYSDPDTVQEGRNVES